jgi:hypothetical protein
MLGFAMVGASSGPPDFAWYARPSLLIKVR